MITAAARRFIMARIANIVTAAGWTWTPPGGSLGPRLFHGVAPEGVTMPFVVVQLLSAGNDIITNNGNRVWSDPLYLVKVVTTGSSTVAIEPIVNQIDAALHVSRGSISGGVVLDCVRVRPHDQPEVDSGKFYSNLGGEYRLIIQEA